jgi:hypothetical protein
MQSYQEHFDKSCELRDKYWKSIGAVEPDVIAHMINPAFMGGPMWPSVRQAFLTIHRPDSTILASDGLSDPYSDMETNEANAPYNGFGLEVYVSTEKLTVPVQNTWQFQLVWQAAQVVADKGTVINLLNDLTYITTEFYNVDVPAEWRNDEDRVGALIGLPNPVMPGEVALSIEPVKIVNIKLLTLPELEYVLENGQEGRTKLVELFLAEGNATLSTIARKSVI